MAELKPPSQLPQPNQLRRYRIYAYDSVRAIFITFNLANHFQVESSTLLPHTHYKEQARLMLRETTLCWPLILLDDSKLRIHVTDLYNLATPLLKHLPSTLSSCLEQYLYSSTFGVLIWDDQTETNAVGMQISPSIVSILCPKPLSLETQRSRENFDLLSAAMRMKADLYPSLERRNKNWQALWDRITTYGAKMGVGSRLGELPIVIHWNGDGDLKRKCPASTTTPGRRSNDIEDREEGADQMLAKLLRGLSYEDELQQREPTL